MSWMAKLYETYEQGLELDLSQQERLMPISHTLQNAHINVVIDGSGAFLRASVLEKTQIVLPATEKSAGRSSGEAPHPLADKLQYVAGDYEHYGGLKKPYFDSYKKQLQAWAESEYSHPSVRAVFAYIEKRCLIHDLVDVGICHTNADKHLLTQWPTELTDEPPALFKVLPKEKGRLDQGNALICWSVHMAGESTFDTWTNTDIQQRWIEYDAQSAKGNVLCFVSGERLPFATNHPAKLRHTGDKAKLVSANDASGFTYRGRFVQSENIANVNYQVTQKAHNALRWLIGPRKQAYRNGDQVIVSWAVSGKKAPSPFEDLTSLLDEPMELAPGSNEADLSVELDITVGLGQQFGVALKRYMQGYYKDFSDTPTESVTVMGLDSATPGRMAITYYRDFMAKDYLDMLGLWYEQFAWPQRVVKEHTNDTRWLPGAPTPWTVLNACYGDVVKSNDALKKQVSERLLPCIVEYRPLPEDLLRLAVNRACNPNSGEYWEWERNLGVACALYKGFHHPDRQPDLKKRRSCTMALDKDNCSRDYLFGRLLAYAEKIEQTALSISNIKRPTTSQRLMQRFADRPGSTWLTIYKQLDPYIRQLHSSRTGFIVNREKEIDEIVDAFQAGDFARDVALSGEFLQGFHSQRLALRYPEKQNDRTVEE